MTTIYVVTSGCYSDYTIEGVFSTREHADAYVLSAAGPEAVAGADEDWPADYRVEEYALDAEEPLKPGCYVARCWLEGYPVRCSEPGFPDLWAWRTRSGGTFASWESGTVSVPAHVKREGSITALVSGYGDTSEHARRACDDLVRAIVAGTYLVPPYEPKKP